MKTFSITTVFAKLFVVIEFSDKFKLRKRKRLLFSGAVLFVAEENETEHLMFSVTSLNKRSLKKSDNDCFKTRKNEPDHSLLQKD